MTYEDLLGKGLVCFQGASATLFPSNKPLISTYILYGEFSFFEGPKCLFFDSEEVIIRNNFQNSELSKIDNIHDENWEHERSLYMERYKRVSVTTPTELTGDRLCLINTQWSSGNIFHLIIDSIGKLSLLAEYRDIDYFTYLIPSNDSRFKEIFDAFKLKYLEYDFNKIYYGNFFIPSMPARCGSVSRSVCRTLKQIGSKISDDINKSEYIFIGRKSPSKRCISNQHDLLCALREFDDFKLYYLEDISTKEKIDLFKRAKIIVAPHGAGLTWSIFNDSPKIFEIFSPLYRNGCYQDLARNSFGKYSYYVGDVDDLNNTPDSDININLNDFKRVFSEFYYSINMDTISTDLN